MKVKEAIAILQKLNLESVLVSPNQDWTGFNDIETIDANFVEGGKLTDNNGKTFPAVAIY